MSLAESAGQRRTPNSEALGALIAGIEAAITSTRRIARLAGLPRLRAGIAPPPSMQSRDRKQGEGLAEGRVSPIVRLAPWRPAGLPGPCTRTSFPPTSSR